ncbi:MAG: polymer-forming cytoskeletal protein [Deltaproteobacteria bacterium]
MKNEKDQINAFLGKDTEFEGKLSFTGAVRLDGRFKGEILTEGTLIVGETALIEADIRVARIIVSGEIRGNIVAGERIEIKAPAKVFGNIQSPTVIIEEGVVFEGNCKMKVATEESDKKVAVLPKEFTLRGSRILAHRFFRAVSLKHCFLVYLMMVGK